MIINIKHILISLIFKRINYDDSLSYTGDRYIYDEILKMCQEKKPDLLLKSNMGSYDQFGYNYTFRIMKRKDICRIFIGMFRSFAKSNIGHTLDIHADFNFDSELKQVKLSNSRAGISHTINFE
jgi:hypothetical protein